MIIPLVDKEDVIDPRSKKRKLEKDNLAENSKDNLSEKDKLAKKDKLAEKENNGKTIIKKKSEKPIRILRIRYYDKISLPFMQDGKLAHKDALAVNRSLEDLLKALGFNTKIQGTTTSHDCIIVEKGNRMGVGNKFIFIDIGTNDFYALKKQMENHTTICAFNQGEFMILDGKRSSLTETFDIPKIWKESKEPNHNISEIDKVDNIESLRDELKDIFRPYHSYDDERIDKMKDQELIDLKRFVNKKIEIENRNRKFYKDLLK